MQKLLDILDDNDDVQNVYHNWDMPETDDEDWKIILYFKMHITPCFFDFFNGIGGLLFEAAFSMAWYRNENMLQYKLEYFIRWWKNVY